MGSLRNTKDIDLRDDELSLLSGMRMEHFSNGLIIAAKILICCVTTLSAIGESHNIQRPFTVADDIGLARFDNALPGTPPVTVSPDGRLVAVRVERGLLKENRLEDELRVYDMTDLRRFMNRSSTAQPPQPVWSIHESTYKKGGLVAGIRWLSDSSGLAFLLKDENGRYQLMLTDLRKSLPQTLSVRGQDVLAYDICDLKHYAYTVRSTDVLRRSAQEKSATAVVMTGRSFTSLLFPEFEAAWDDRSDLWAATDGFPHPVVSSTGSPVILYEEGQLSMALSPDGYTLATSVPVSNVPPDWQTHYRPPTEGDAHRIHAGLQPIDANAGPLLVSQYVTIDLHTGKVHSITAAPTGRSAHWVAGGIAALAWSADGRFLALPSTFVATGTSRENSAPCLAVADLVKDSVRCLQTIEATYTRHGAPAPQYFFIDKLEFQGLTLSMHYRHYDQSKGIRDFARASSGDWQQVSDTMPSTTFDGLDLSIHEGLNDPPVLVAKDIQTQVSRVIWNPNPQLESVQIPDATVYQWKDKAANQWIGGLYKPADYIPGHRYPLVIQTHGFTDKLFLPSGTMNTAFAARALAAAGIIVLQVRGCPLHVTMTPREAPCEVEGYEAAVRQLTDDGLINPEDVGIIGFSRTCYYVMQALTSSSLRFTAASITDGENYGYWQYLLAVDLLENGISQEYEAIYKSQPFGEGLQQWIDQSPEFKMQRVNAPLMIVGEGAASLLDMWEPYAALRHMHKPTDLIMVNTDEHILTNPAVRMASQGGSVDWFRFWLQGYEDPARAKAEQYRRWERLCSTQRTQYPKDPAYCVESNQNPNLNASRTGQ